MVSSQRKLRTTENSGWDGQGDLDEGSFESIAKLAYELSGLSFARSSRSLISSRLGRHLRELGLSDWSSYVAILRRREIDQLERFINLLTTNKTEFFREKSHFEEIERKIRSNTGFAAEAGKILYCWVAAASRGQEVYTLAMVLDKVITETQRFSDYRILATDIDTDVLEVAKQGVYALAEVQDSVPLVYQAQSFLRGTGRNRGYAKVSEKIRSRVKFRTHNLIHPAVKLSVAFDLVLVRNVFIYFDGSGVHRALTGILTNMRKDSELCIGICESIDTSELPLEGLGGAIYRKTA